MASSSNHQSLTPEDITYIRESFRNFEMMANLTLLSRELFDQTEVDLKTINKATATNFIANRIATYSRSKLCADDTLFNLFKEDLEGWNADTFRLVAKDILKDLKLFLRYRGVYTGHKNLPHITAIMNLITSDDPLKWPENELVSSDLDPRCRTYKQQQNLLSPTSRDNLLLHQSSSSSSNAHPVLEENIEQKNPNYSSATSANQPQIPSFQQERIEVPRAPQDAYPRTAPLPPTAIYHQPQPNNNKPNNHDLDPYNAIPPISIPNGPINVNCLEKFIKLWDKSPKYDGKDYNLLDPKIYTMYSICRMSGIHIDQFHAVFFYILDGAARDHYCRTVKSHTTFREAYYLLKNRFEDEDTIKQYYADWTRLTYGDLKTKHPDKDPHTVLNLLFDKLLNCQQALGPDYTDNALRASITQACRGYPEFISGLLNPPNTTAGLFASLRASLRAHLDLQAGTQGHLLLQDHEDHDLYFLDRQYRRNNLLRAQKPSQTTTSRYSTNRPTNSSPAYRSNSFPTNNSQVRHTNNRLKRCFVCNRENCWSTKHTIEERRRAKQQWLIQAHFETENPHSYEVFSSFLQEYEGLENENKVENIEHAEGDDDDLYQAYPATSHFMAPGYTTNTDLPTSLWPQTQQALANYSFIHNITADNPYSKQTATTSPTSFYFDDRYNHRYEGIIPDTGAAELSTVGYPQFEALRLEDDSISLDVTNKTGCVRFGEGNTIQAIGTTTIPTQLGLITFHVLNTSTPFLLCLRDMDRLQVYLDNTSNELVQGKLRIPVIRKWGHPFFHLRRDEASCVFLTESELRQIHRRFGHPATTRLYTILSKAGHTDVDITSLQQIEKFCHHCQLHGSSPRRFKFSLKDHDDVDFNFELILDTISLKTKSGQRNVLHIVDTATSFQAGGFLKSLSAKDAWDLLRKAWINTYLGPPDRISHDAGTNFAAQEFKTEATSMGITCKQAPTEAHWSVGKVERYHMPLRRVFEILYSELSSTHSDDDILQMSFKALNDTVNPKGLVPTLLVFGAFPRITNASPPSPSITKRANAIQKAMKELRRLQAEKAINSAIHTRNGPQTHETLLLPIGSYCLVYRGKEGWTGPYKILGISGHTVTVETTNGPIDFRSTVVKPYYHKDETQDNIAVQTTRKRGRPSKESQKSSQQTAPQNNSHHNEQTIDIDSILTNPSAPLADTYITEKEHNAFELASKLRKDGIITAPGGPFEESDRNEIADLFARGVFEFHVFNPAIHSHIRIFKSRLVRSVKNVTSKPYEKSRLVIQGYNDREKQTILTQSPTIQRASQRLLLAIAPSLITCLKAKVELRDITQAYTQSATPLFRDIFAHLPIELRDKYPEGTILKVVRPLYGIAEAGVHWFVTYQSHHIEKLNMVTSTYDPCLLISNNNSKNEFGMIAMQTDDTLILATKSFSEKENQQINQVGFKTKPKTELQDDKPLEFNGCTIVLQNDTIHSPTIKLTQKGQYLKLNTIDITKKDPKHHHQKYIEQRARGAYIASICQPEASCDFSTLAQIRCPEIKDYKRLNTRIDWQINNLSRGIQFIPLDLATAKLFVFTDGSFANNQDLSSQLGFVIVLANEQNNSNSFTITGNIIQWSSTKAKRVTRSVLASEIYGMVNGIDTGLVIASTLQLITDELAMPTIPLIVCTDSYSLYDCLVRLGTTREKRLMVDIMALRQMYERREIFEARWINGQDNPADAMTKASPNRALEKLVSNNSLTIRVEGSVQRPEQLIKSRQEKEQPYNVEQ